MNTALSTESKKSPTLLQKIESIESILHREHEPAEIQEKIDQLQAGLEGGDLAVKEKIEIALLHQVREKIKTLLLHEALQVEHHETTRANLEKIKSMLHPMQSIARMYDYSPHPNTIHRIDLGVDWDPAKKGFPSQIFAILMDLIKKMKIWRCVNHPVLSFLRKSYFKLIFPIKMASH